jgi:hypothetical protein
MLNFIYKKIQCFHSVIQTEALARLKERIKRQKEKAPISKPTYLENG